MGVSVVLLRLDGHSDFSDSFLIDFLIDFLDDNLDDKLDVAEIRP